MSVSVNQPVWLMSVGNFTFISDLRDLLSCRATREILLFGFSCLLFPLSYHVFLSSLSKLNDQ